MVCVVFILVLVFGLVVVVGFFKGLGLFYIVYFIDDVSLIYIGVMVMFLLVGLIVMVIGLVVYW